MSQSSASIPFDAHEDRLLELSSLADGWLDGDGRALQPAILTCAREFLKCLSAEEQQDLHIFPTVDGGILFEQYTDTHGWSLEINTEGQMETHLVPVDRDQPTEVFRHDQLAETAKSFRLFLSYL